MGSRATLGRQKKDTPNCALFVNASQRHSVSALNTVFKPEQHVLSGLVLRLSAEMKERQSTKIKFEQLTEANFSAMNLKKAVLVRFCIIHGWQWSVVVAVAAAADS
ncbi:hypothetical protein F0562_002394 [Nyssa sinensis]|uniref:Uncharacterized protein n=1 Tax=Nyssa sinensis TaxID=561372 RepID=A0A5J5C9H9_9ASTE|nr:hypothetical protein F0562_002394 [Nyssa sinensis]